MAGDINRVTLVGRLTRDPELRHLPSGSPVLQMGLAVNGRQKDEGGNWIDKPNFFDIKVFGNQAEMLAQHLSKGRRVGIDETAGLVVLGGPGRLQTLKVEIVAFTVQFLDSRGEGGGGASTFPRATSQPIAPTSARRAPTTTSPSRADQGVARQMARADEGTQATARWGTAHPAGRAATSARTRSTRSTTRTRTSFGATSPRRGRSARAGSRAPAGAARSRSQSRWRTQMALLPYVESR